jgi:NADH-quinone oxidoreductase subunit J
VSALQIIFLLVAAGTLAAAVCVVSVRRMMHAALWLVLALMGVAVMMALLETRFFAIVQLLVYIGAIAILIIVGVMLTHRMMDDQAQQVIRAWPLAALASMALMAGLIAILGRWNQTATVVRAVPAGGENIQALGLALVDPAGFVMPFEVASVLLLAAMVGAIFVALDQKGSLR